MAEKGNSKSAKEILKSLFDFVEGPEEDVRTIPLEKVIKDLKKEGIDPNPLIKNVRDKIASAKAEQIMSKASVERQRISQLPLTPIANVLGSSVKDRALSALKQLSISQPTLANAYARKLDKFTDADFISMLEDLALLDSIQDEDDTEI